MATNRVWLITGAGRGLGVDIAKAALAGDHKVVATGRNTDEVARALGKSAELLVVKLDITKPADAESAVKTAVDRFGRIDVLVNNAANFYAGFFEELSPEQMERQLSTSLVGPMNVTRAVLPVMEETPQDELVRLRKTQIKAVQNEVYGGLSQAEKAEYNRRAERIRELEKVVAMKRSA
jgi:NAD(P)-dependent dehydrogenase (short-subunit alcohol dehydrogenase family)